MVKRTLKYVYLGFLYLFLYAPVIVLIVYSFNAGKYTSSWEGFSLKWYQSLFKDRTIMTSLYYTVVIGVLSALIATVIGTLAAYAIHSMSTWKRNVLLSVNNLPVINPDIVTGIALMTLFAAINMRLGFVTMLLAHITFNIPYVILSVLPKFKQLSSDTVEAAMDLGATPSYAFRKVILPEIMPGIITGMLIAFTMSIDDFVISFFTTGSGVTNLSITIFSMTKRGVKPEINALSALMFVTVITLLVIINLRTKDQEE